MGFSLDKALSPGDAVGSCQGRPPQDQEGLALRSCGPPSPEPPEHQAPAGSEPQCGLGSVCTCPGPPSSKGGGLLVHTVAPVSSGLWGCPCTYSSFSENSSFQGSLPRTRRGSAPPGHSQGPSHPQGISMGQERTVREAEGDARPPPQPTLLQRATGRAPVRSGGGGWRTPSSLQ